MQHVRKQQEPRRDTSLAKKGASALSAEYETKVMFTNIKELMELVTKKGNQVIQFNYCSRAITQMKEHR